MSTLTEATEALNALVVQYGLARDQLVDVAGGPADGGPNGDGWYPITLASGDVVSMPSIAKLLTLTAAARGPLMVSWAELEPLAATAAIDDEYSVDAADGGTHTEPGVGSVPNSGTFRLVAGTPNYFKRTGNLLTADIAAALVAFEAVRDDVLTDPGFMAIAADLAGDNHIGAIGEDLAGDNNIGAVVAGLPVIGDVAEKIAEVEVVSDIAGRISPYPLLGLETSLAPAVQADAQMQSWQTRDGRELRVRPDAIEGVDRGSRYAAFVQPGTGNLIVGDMTSGASITIPRVASWAGGPTLDYQLAGWAGGYPLIATSRALKGPISLMMASTAGMAPAYDPKVMYIFLTLGQSTGGETNGKHFDATHLYAPMTMPPAVFMLQRKAHSDLRCARYSDWDSGLSVPVDPATITGIMPFGPRPLPNNTWTSQVFGDGMLSRILKVMSDRFHAVHGRRQPMLGTSLAFGGISNVNRSKTGAANIPGYSITAYANNIQIMTALRDVVIAAGYIPVVPMVFDAHGETGAADTNYAAVEAQYQTDLNADIRAIFGQAGDPIWVEAGITSAVAVEEVESLKGIRANHNNGKILIASVDYELLADQGFEVAGWPKPPNPDYVHHTNRGYHRRGEAAGHVGADMLCLNRTAKMTQPVPGASLTNVGGNVWRWPFESESGTIEIAAAPGFDVPVNAGLTYRDSGGGALINSVALAPGGTGLDITMSTDVSARPGREWRIAMNGKGEGQSHGPTVKCRSPVRDPVSPGVSEATGATRWRHTLPAHAN